MPHLLLSLLLISLLYRQVLKYLQSSTVKKIKSFFFMQHSKIKSLACSQGAVNLQAHVVMDTLTQQYG